MKDVKFYQVTEYQAYPFRSHNEHNTYPLLCGK